ncbi:hypothetical protein HW555_007579 [Spodoptera exigua]|uniref:Uncharacterized protein n=1 Tax=Spodoptera exigua TaxID=7107 RepID=A0A835L591_SPOEX|nr:hypothetical protein HW555_007579 [Spodoptera exigua]
MKLTRSLEVICWNSRPYFLTDSAYFCMFISLWAIDVGYTCLWTSGKQGCSLSSLSSGGAATTTRPHHWQPAARLAPPSRRPPPHHSSSLIDWFTVQKTFQTGMYVCTRTETVVPGEQGGGPVRRVQQAQRRDVGLQGAGAGPAHTAPAYGASAPRTLAAARWMDMVQQICKRSHLNTPQRASRAFASYQYWASAQKHPSLQTGTSQWPRMYQSRALYQTQIVVKTWNKYVGYFFM